MINMCILSISNCWYFWISVKSFHIPYRRNLNFKKKFSLDLIRKGKGWHPKVVCLQRNTLRLIFSQADSIQVGHSQIITVCWSAQNVRSLSSETLQRHYLFILGEITCNHFSCSHLANTNSEEFSSRKKDNFVKNVDNIAR